MKKIVWILLLFILLSCSVHASANSAMHYWHGSDASGVALKDKDCPLVVTHEDLDFYILDLPTRHSSNEAYKSYLSAKYTFFNPTEEEITASLLFPFGTQPDYFYDLEWKVDESDYKVKIDDQLLENGRLRFTYGNTANFSVSKAIKQVRDDYQEHSFYRLDLPIYHHTYRVSGINSGTQMVLDLSSYEGFDAFSEEFTFNSTTKEFRAYALQSGKEIDLYFVGKIPEQVASNVSFYSDLDFKYKVSGSFELIKKEEETFSDWVFRAYQEEYGISKVDWYNAVVDKILERGGIGYAGINDVHQELMYWQEYEMVVPAKASIINEVIAPLYPDIDYGYSPEKFCYTYLLSPASTWKSFADLTITIHTDLFLLKSSLNDFKMNEEEKGYQLHLESLPDEELTFELCTSADPKLDHSGLGWLIPVLMILIIILSIPLIGMICVIISRYKRYRNAPKKVKKHLICLILQGLCSTALLFVGMISSAANAIIIGGILCLIFSIAMLAFLIIEKVKFKDGIIGRLIVILVSLFAYLMCFISEDTIYYQMDAICIFAIVFGFVLYIWAIVKLTTFKPVIQEEQNDQKSNERYLPIGYLSNHFIILQAIVYLIWLVAMCTCFIILSLSDQSLWLAAVLFVLAFLVLFFTFAILLQLHNVKDFKVFYQDLDYDKLEKNVLTKLSNPAVHPETKNYFLMLLAGVAIAYSLERYVALKKQIFIPKNKLYIKLYDGSQLNWLLSYEELLNKTDELKRHYEKKKRVIAEIDQFVKSWEFYYKKTDSANLEALVSYHTKNEYLNAIHLFIQIHHYQNHQDEVKVEELRMLFFQKYACFTVLVDELNGVDVRGQLNDLLEEQMN